MTGFMLDTNIISEMIRHPAGSVAHRVEQVGPKDICTSIVVAAELRYGCVKKGSARLTERVAGLLETILILPIDVPADYAYGRIRAELEAAGETIGSNDLLIAAQARTLGLTLVTDNVREFQRVRDLDLENWLDRPTRP